jgi:hypothetical protein
MATEREELEQLRLLARGQQPITPQASVVQPESTERQELEQLRTLATKEDELTGFEKFKDFFTGKSRETPETRELPEIGSISTGEFGKNLRISAGLLASTDPQDQMDVIKEVVPEATFSKDAKGNDIVDFGEGKKAILNKPGASFQDVAQTAAQIISFIPSAKVATLGKTLLAKVGLGAAGAGATEAGLQVGARELGAKDAVRPEEIGLAAALGGASEAVVPALQAVRGIRQAKSVGGEDVGQVVESLRGVEEAAEATGVPLFQAQKTTIPAQLEKQSFIASLPAGTQKASQSLRKQNRAASRAVDDFLGTIAPDEAVVTGAPKFRTASQNAVEAQKLVRKEKASPLYKQALKEGADVDLKPVNELIDLKLNDFPEAGGIYKTLKKAQELIKGEPTLKKIHNAKLEIDEIINKTGEGSIGNTAKNELTDIKNLLLTQMDDASDLYRSARETFAAESPAVTKIQESIIGKIADIDDTQLKAISRRIFDPAETNPAVIKQAKKVIDDVDPDAWNELLRTELERRLGSVKSTMEEGTVENIPGQLFNAIFGNTKQRAVLFNAVDGEAAKNLKYLEIALGRAKLGRPGGSQTAAREEIKRELRGGVLQSVREFFRQPISTLAATGEDIAFNKRVRALAEVVFDPQWRPQMKKLKKLNLDSPAAARAMTQLLNDATREENK